MEYTEKFQKVFLELSDCFEHGAGMRLTAIELQELFLGIKAQYKEVDRLKSLTQWVRVEDRLPEEEGLYCVTGKYVDGHVKVFSCYFKGNSYQNHGGYIWETSVKEITHWMPLPLPPEGVK